MIIIELIIAALIIPISFCFTFYRFIGKFCVSLPEKDFDYFIFFVFLLVIISFFMISSYQTKVNSERIYEIERKTNVLYQQGERS